MESNIENGYLLLADISGYTAFIEQSELAHAPLVLNHIITFLLGQLTPAMRLIEIEGDAVFLYASENEISRGELLLELTEATYINFRDRQSTMMYNITCSCNACRAVKTLDLKFVVHFGRYSLLEVAGKVKPIGSCINLVHRLLKNSVTKSTGWQGYALFSKACVDQMDIYPTDMHSGQEHYEHIGRVDTFSLNLQKKYETYLTDRVVRVTDQEADVKLEYDFEVAPPVLWDWLNDPVKRNKWSKKSNWVVGERPEGRLGKSANNHCTASKTMEYILDWRPFHYYTVKYQKGLLHFMLTNELTPLHEGTRLKWNLRLQGMLPRWVMRVFSRIFAYQLIEIRQSFGRLNQMSESKYSRGR